MKKEFQAISIPDMPTELHAAAKAAAATKRISLKAWIVQAIQEKVKEEGKLYYRNGRGQITPLK